MAAAKLDLTIEAAIREHLIEAEKVRSTKEQADILLTVLAMDYLHSGVGRFILVTGDQDFIPLIRRLHRGGRDVTVIYGDPSRLSAELRRTLATTPGLESLDIAEVTTLRERKPDTGCRSLLGLLELQRRGFMLGGREHGQRTELLLSWGVIENQDESQYWSLIRDMTEKVTRSDVPKLVGDRWLPQNATRTYLNLNAERLADITAIDYTVRQLSGRTKGLTMGQLRTGSFQTDDGTRLDRVLDALSAAEIIRKGADGTYSLVGPGMQLGYLEPLWRVYAGLSAECFKRQVASIPNGQLESLLGRKGIGQGQDQRAAGRIKEAVRYASSAGVTDICAVDGKRHVAPISSALCRQFEQGYHELYREFSVRLDDELPVTGVMDFMEKRDSSRSVPLFGYDNRDHHRIIRILSQSHLLSQRGDKVAFHQSRWGETGVALAS